MRAPRPAIVWFVAASLVATGAAAWYLGGASSRTASRTVGPATSAGGAGRLDAVRSEAAVLDADLAFYETRLANDPESAGDHAMVAQLYMTRARATASFQDFERAEGLARRSLALRSARNAHTYGLLASALLARHAFGEAREAAQRAVELSPGDAAALAQLAEIELEMGDYDSANTHFAGVWVGRDQFTVAARVARWHEIMGRTAEARALLQRAVRAVERRDDLPREQVAWFRLRLGELDLRSGRYAAADSSLRRGLEIFPDDYRILGALARAALARGEHAEAVSLGERATAIVLEPTTLGTISEAYGAMGDSAQATAFAEAMATAALQQPGPIHRAWGLFLLDHGTARDARMVLARAREELRERPDVYGLDLLAWALHRTGDHTAAAAAMRQALTQQTEDPQLLVHAAAIEREIGHPVAVEGEGARPTKMPSPR